MTGSRDDPPEVKTPLQRQITLTLSGVIIGLVLLVGLPLVFISVRIQQQASAREQQDLANRAAQNLASVLQALQAGQLSVSLTDMENSEVNFLATQLNTILNLTISRVSAQVQEALAEGAPLETILEANPQIQGVGQFSRDGTPQRSAWRGSPAAARTLQPSPESLQLTQQGINTLEAFFFDEGYIPVAIIATPITEEEQISGLVLSWVTIPTIWNYLIDWKVGQKGYLYIIDQDGHLVAGPGQLSGQSSPPAILAASPARNPYRGLSGQQVVGRVADIENTPWRVVIEIPVAEASRSLRSLLIILAAILLFGISLAISMARLFSRWLLQPIHTLHQSATRISEGDLAHRISLDRQDELGFLAGAFNQMVATLERTINELRTVSLNLLSAQEMERRRIAGEIHDELGQMLTALRLNLWVSMQGDPDNQNLAAAHQQATHIQEKARSLSHELRPAMLDDLGLLPTLEWYIDRVEQRANLAIVLEAQFDEACLSPTVKTALYRLIAEALTNITNHAQASVVEIKLRQEDQNLELTISDDGRGFDPASLAQTQSLGLAGMRERVNLLQGQFLLESQPGAGTQIAITLPLQS